MLNVEQKMDPASWQEGFAPQPPSLTGVTFTNRLDGDVFLTDAVAHNGSGVAIGDVNGDGLEDLFFCGLLSANQLYLNRGHWLFENLPLGEAACQNQRSTSAVFSDVDGDRDLDLLVGGIASGLRLFINNGSGQFRESTDSGLDRTTSPASLALADLDRDGDLDLYCANYIDVMYTADPTTKYALGRSNGRMHVTSVNGRATTEPGLQNRFTVSAEGKLRELPEADGLYLNDGKGHFAAIQGRRGTFQDPSGKPVQAPRDWSLAVSFRDLNQDGWPDLYVCSDNATPDRLWLNDQQGGFRAADTFALRHTSRSSMGVDVADVNQDGLDDIFVVDMLASDHGKRLQQLVKQHSSFQEIMLPQGRPRYNRNTLFLAQTNGRFSEVALIAGVSASDWSWCPIFMDVDLDGDSDLLISNGFSFDVMDQDSHDRLKTMNLTMQQRERSRQYHPPFPTPNIAFRNRGDGTFESAPASWGFGITGISYGMALGDLDNDGDQDVVINQLNESPILLHNLSNRPRLKVVLKGRSHNTHAVGTRLVLRTGSKTQSHTVQAGGRYLSSDGHSQTFALSQDASPTASMSIHWPDGSQNQIHHLKINQRLTIEQPEEPLFPVAEKETSREMVFVREQTIVPDQGVVLPPPPSLTSPSVFWRPPRSGDLAIHDIDHDGLMDVWIEGSPHQNPRMLIQRPNGRLAPVTLSQEATKARGKALGWTAGDSVSYWLVSTRQTRLPDGKQGEKILFIDADGKVIQTLEANIPAISSMHLMDIDQDGDLDLFLGAFQPDGPYNESSMSQWWRQDNGQWHRDEAFDSLGKSLNDVSDAAHFPAKETTPPTLLVASEWGPIRSFIWTAEGGYQETTSSWGLDQWSGAWSSIEVEDFDRDGFVDLLVGGLGLNTEWALTKGLIFGKLEWGDPRTSEVLRLFAFQKDDQWWSMEDLNTLRRRLPDLFPAELTHQEFAQQPLSHWLDTVGMTKNDWKSIQHMEAAILWNKGESFAFQALPSRLQRSPVRSMFAERSVQEENPRIYFLQNAFHAQSLQTRLDAGGVFTLSASHPGTWEIQGSQLTGLDLIGEPAGGGILSAKHADKKRLAIIEANGVLSVFRQR